MELIYDGLARIEKENHLTASKILERGQAMIPSNKQEDSTLEQYSVSWANQGMAEFLYAENAVRRSRGIMELHTAPVITATDDIVPFTEVVTSRALVYYFASFAAKDDDDMSSFMEFYRRAVEGANESCPVTVGTVLNTTFNPREWVKLGHQFDGREG